MQRSKGYPPAMSVIAMSGRAQILASATATTFFGDSLRLRLPVQDSGITVEFQFIDDEGEIRADVHEEEWGLSLHLYNFGSSPGKGSADPMLLAEMGPDLLFLHFRVFRWGLSQDHTVHYTFYRAAKEDLGWTPHEESP